jgi:hypothetical protein
MIGLYIFLFIILFVVGGLLTFLHHKVSIEEPKNGWKKFDDEKSEDT